MTFYRRRLPHLYSLEHPVFLTWRLYDSLAPNRAFPAGEIGSGRAFAAMDRLLDEARAGQFYLRQPAVADMLATPAVALPKLTKSLKGITAKRANAILASTGSPFWQEESYDHLVRHAREFEKIRNYIEGNPVRAGLVREASEYRWSSAGWATGGSPADQGADQGVRPTNEQ